MNSYTPFGVSLKLHELSVKLIYDVYNTLNDVGHEGRTLAEKQAITQLVLAIENLGKASEIGMRSKPPPSIMESL